jgi:hypothetical protein
MAHGGCLRREIFDYILQLWFFLFLAVAEVESISCVNVYSG